MSTEPEVTSGVFVTGTDTGVGKSCVSAGLLAAARQVGLRVPGLKPVVSGVIEGGSGGPEAGEARQIEEGVGRIGTEGPGGAVWWEDLETLALADGGLLSASERSVYRFAAPASPHFAAAEEGREVRLDPLLEAVALAREVFPDGVLVEGVGGWRVPFSRHLDSAQFAQALQMPVILVVGLRLGCINHALLTAESVRLRGLRLAGWVANAGVDPDYPRVAQTVATLEQRLHLPVGAVLPVLPRVPAPLTAERKGGRWQEATQRQIAASTRLLSPLLADLRAKGCFT